MENILKNLSTRLMHALHELDISQAELARRIGVSQQAIQRLCKNNAYYSKFTFEIAAALGIEPAWLATGKGYMLPEQDPQKQMLDRQKKVPILSEKEIIDFLAGNKKIPDISSNQWVLSDACLNKNCFGYQLKDKSMSPRFDENTIIIINPNTQPKNLSFVLAYIEKENMIILRQFLKTNKKILLTPTNTTLFNTIEADPAITIIGTMCEARWKLE